MIDANDVKVLRDLARQVAEIAAKPIQDERRELWRRHNSLIKTRPPIYNRWPACWSEVFPDERLRCADPLFRAHERCLRQFIFQDSVGDDYIIEPFVTVKSTYATPDGRSKWGVEVKRHPTTEPGGSWLFDPPIKTEEDLDSLVPPRHAIDERASARDLERIGEAIGDILQVVQDRAPIWSGWAADISTELAGLRGLEQMMWDMVDRPKWLHKLLAFMRDGVLAAQQQAEDAGDWRPFNHNNQAMTYARELPDPAGEARAVARKDLWIFMASQETTLVSPAMFDEFIVQYQLPIIARYGLCAYGCCEDLTCKIDVLRQIPSLRRIAVTPWADLARCAEQIGRDYVISWRPSPAEMVCTAFDRDRIRRTVREAMEICRGLNVEVTLKDVQTVGGDFNRLIEWTRITREVVEDYG